MTPEQAHQVLRILTAAWPNHDMPDDTIRLWVGTLGEMEHSDAMSAAKSIVNEDRYFPTIARLRQTEAAAKHARRNRESADRGLPTAPQAIARPERVRTTIAQVRATLDVRRGAGGHDHHGPNPCPVCGGMAEPKAQPPNPWDEE